MQRLSPFTLIVTFVCLALVGLALASGQAESVAHIAGLYGALQHAGHFVAGGGDGGNEQTGIHVGSHKRGKSDVFYFR